MNTKDAQVLTGCTWADADSVADILEEVFDIRPVLSFAFNWALDLSLGTIPQDIVTPSMAQSYLRCDWDTASRMAPRLQELFRMAESTHAIIIWYNKLCSSILQTPKFVASANKNMDYTRRNLAQPLFPIESPPI